MSRTGRRTLCLLASGVLALPALVFSRAAAGEKRVYKILTLLEPKSLQLSAAALEEFRRLVAEDFRVRDIFYSRGLHVIFDK